MKKSILNIANTIIGKKGQIGFRTGYIIDYCIDNGIPVFNIARGTTQIYKSCSLSMKMFKHVPRLLNLYRIKINLQFNHRKYDIRLFERFFIKQFDKIPFRPKETIVFLQEYSSVIINKLHDAGFKIVLDVPIAPQNYVKNLIQQTGLNGLSYHSYLDKIERDVFLLADYIVAPSLFVKEEIVKLGISDDKITIVPFGVDFDNIQKKCDKDYKTKGIDYCFAGTINTRKGIEYLLEVWDNDDFKNDRLHLCGMLFPNIKKIIKQKKLNNIILPGFVSTQEYFNQCDVYVFPSLMEGSTKSIYEAMNRSLPVIATFESGSVIKDMEDGIIVKIHNSVSLYEAMMFFKNNPEQISRMGQNAKCNIAHFTWDHYSKKILQILQK